MWCVDTEPINTIQHTRVQNCLHKQNTAIQKHNTTFTSTIQLSGVQYSTQSTIEHTQVKHMAHTRKIQHAQVQQGAHKYNTWHTQVQYVAHTSTTHGKHKYSTAQVSTMVRSDVPMT